ncbi:trigger factor [soil metagenome]
MKTTIKHLSDTKVELTISVSPDELADAEKVALVKLAKNVKVQGFRKGKVPLAVAQKNVDPAKLQEQALDDAVSKAVAVAFTEEKIQALDRPSVEIKKFVPGEILEFTAETEILPKITLGNYKKLKVAVAEKITISAKDVDEVIGRMSSGMATQKDVERAAKDGDETVIDFIGKKDGVAFDGGTGSDYALTLGSHSFIPGFEEAIIGHKPGETFDIDLKFPADYHVADLKSAPVTFTTTLKSIKESTTPVIDDAFATSVGPFKTVAEMKADIKRELTEQKKRESHDKVKDNLVSQLIEVSKIPLPQVLLDDQARSIEQDFERNLMYQGIDLDQYLTTQKFKDKDEWINKEVKPTAEKRVKAGLVLAELSKAEKIEASTDELIVHIDMYRKQYANNPEALKQFDDPEVQRDIANRLLTEKTVERLVDLNTK